VSFLCCVQYIHSVPIKNRLVKILYFSNDSTDFSQTFRLLWVFTRQIMHFLLRWLIQQLNFKVYCCKWACSCMQNIHQLSTTISKDKSWSNAMTSFFSRGRACSYPLWQRMDLHASCATNCTVPTADKSNHSTTGMIHPHCYMLEIVEKDCEACGLNREDAMDRSRWMKQIRDDWWPW